MGVLPFAHVTHITTIIGHAQNVSYTVAILCRLFSMFAKATLLIIVISVRYIQFSDGF